MKKNRVIDKETRPLYIISALALALALGMTAWFFLGNGGDHTKPIDELVTEEKKEDGTPCPYRRALDGVCVDSKEEMYSDIVAVMIENHSEARPQSGLADARVVYEAPVEANYSRFMAIFSKDTKVDKVGPVRSARPYYLNWALEYGDPMYMHVGGSDDALDKIDEENIFDMNEFYRGWYFWRSTDRYAPHNTYTSQDLWTKAWDNYGKEKKTDGYQSWVYSDEALEPCVDSCANTITATFLAPTYEAVWKYVSSTHQYERYQGGKPHVDHNGNHIVADTVIVQRVQSSVLGAVGRIMMDTMANGQAVVFRDGHAIPGTWVKAVKKDKTMWRDAEGKDIPLRSGKIWIEVVNQVGKVQYN